MAIDLEQIKRNYENFDDFKLEYLAKNEAGSFEPEVISILMEEIKKRGLDSNLEKAINAQTKELTESELNEFKNKIVNLTCPECGQKNTPLVGSLIRTVRSFIVLTFSKKVPAITCIQCAKKKKKNAIISTALLGWWGIPFGLFKTPIALIATLRDSKKKEEISNGIITAFIIENLGEIRTSWDKEDELVDFVRHVNKNQ